MRPMVEPFSSMLENLAADRLLVLISLEPQDGHYVHVPFSSFLTFANWKAIVPEPKFSVELTA
jgi:hypothetical protein